MTLQFIQVIEELLRGGNPVRFRAPGLSMHPTIRHGDIITVAPLGGAPVRVGDVLLYRRGRAAIAHRVIHLQACAGAGRSVHLVLQGDAARCCDPAVELEQVLGRVRAVERDSRTIRLDFLSPFWSRALGRGLRVAHDFRTRVAGLLSSVP